MRISIETFDKLPKLARQALANSDLLGTCRADQRITIKLAKASVMVERINRADAMLHTGSNLERPRGSLRTINAILSGEL